jgi:hypothetical protein
MRLLVFAAVVELLLPIVAIGASARNPFSVSGRPNLAESGARRYEGAIEFPTGFGGQC